MDGAICIGDHITLFSEETGGFLSPALDSDSPSEVSCFKQYGDRNRLDDAFEQVDVLDKNVITFEVCSTNKYVAERKLRKREAKQEKKENEVLHEKQLGRKVFYGQVIQLRSVSTGRYVDSSRTAHLSGNSSYHTVNLSRKNGKSSQFRFVQPRLRNDKGGMVKVGDHVTIQTVKDGSGCLHLLPDSSGKAAMYGVETSPTSATEFKIGRIYRPTRATVAAIHTGEIIQLYDKQLGSLLVADYVSSSNLQVFLEKTSADSDNSNHKQPGPFTSYWQIEAVKSVDGVLHWDNHCRLLHVSTQSFLCLDPNSRFVLVSDRTDRRTIFKLQPTTLDIEIVQADSYINLQSIDGKCWLCPADEPFLKNKVVTEKVSLFVSRDLITDKIECRPVHSTRNKHGADVLQAVRVESDTFRDICNIQELLTRINAYLQKKQRKPGGSHKMAHLLDNLHEFNTKLSSDGDRWWRQNMQGYMCESGLLTLLFKLMEQPLTEPDQRLMERLYVETSGLITACLHESTTEVKVYAAAHMDFCLQEIRNQPSPLNHRALLIVVEMIQDNVPLVSQVTDQQIDQIFNLFLMDRNFLYFRLLGAFCICQGEAIYNNQVYIVNKLVEGDDKQDLCYLSYMGEHIGLKEHTVYVSTNNGKPWLQLKDVYKHEEVKLYYQHQLNFFKVLCFGGNSRAVRSLTKELGFITFDHLKWSMADLDLAPEDRAIYCQLITVMFIEDTREPVFGKVPTAFDCTNLYSPQVMIPDSQMEPIISWANTMIKENEVLFQSLDEKNLFLSAILDMVQKLIMFGYYGNTKTEHQRYITGIVKLLDGRTDAQSKDLYFEQELKFFQHDMRFRSCSEEAGICIAKISALGVIDLFLNEAIAASLLDFIKLFEKNVDSFNGNGRDIRVHDVSLFHPYWKQFQNDVNPTSYPFDEHVLRDILLDLTQYDHDDLRYRALSTLNRYYSVREEMFEQAKIVQVLRSEKSQQDFKTIQALGSTLKQILRSQTDLSHNDEIKQGLEELTRLSKSDVPEHVNQMLLFNTGLFDIVFQQTRAKIVAIDEIFILMKWVTRDNHYIQRYMFDHLDELLLMISDNQTVVEAVIEIFQGSAEMCMQIKHPQVKRIVELLAEYKFPSLIDLLHVLVRPYHGCTLEGNQHEVIVHLATYRKEIFKLLDNPGRERLQLLTDDTYKHTEYIKALLNLMATCAEDKKSFRDTFCHSICLDEVLDVLNGNGGLYTKLTCLRFIANVFVPFEGTQMFANHLVWDVIRSFDSVFQHVKENVTSDPGLILRCSSFPHVQRASWKLEERLVVYMLQGVFPFLKGLFNGINLTDAVRQQFQTDLDNLDSVLQMFFMDMRVYIDSVPHVLEMIKGVLKAVHSANTGVEENIDNLMRSQHQMVPALGSSNPEENKDDDKLNETFQFFTDKMFHLYEQANKPTKTSVHSNSDAYKTAGQPTNLPQSDKFTSFVRCFINDEAETVEGKYAAVTAICKYLMFSSTHIQTKEKEMMKLDVKCFQVLRALLHSEMAQLPTQSHLSVKNCQSHFNKLEEVQNILVKLGCVDCVFSHLHKGHQGQGHFKVITQALALLSELLFYRNESVQVCIQTYMTTYSDEVFFQTIHHILQEGIEEYKARKLTWSSVTKDKSVGGGHRRTSYRSGSKSIKHSQVAPLIEHSHRMDLDTVNSSSAKALLSTAIEILGNFGGPKCEVLKNLLREQPNHSVSYNLIGDCTALMVTLHTQLDEDTVELYTHIVRALTTLVSDNAGNQSTFMDNGGMDGINHILVPWKFNYCGLDQILELKIFNILLARSLVEMNYDSRIESRHEHLPKFIAEQIDTGTLFSEVKDMWKALNWNQGEESRLDFVYIKDREMLTQICHQYILLLARVIDLNPSVMETGLAKEEADIEVFRQLEMKIASIELVKDGVPQKHYFITGMKNEPPKHFRQSFQEEVDRSSPDSKLQELVSRASEYGEKVSLRMVLTQSWYPFGKIFLKSWVQLNFIMFVPTLMLIVYISVAMHAPDTESVKFRNPDYVLTLGEVFVYILGGIHNFISALIFIYFVLTEGPSIQAFSHIGSIPEKKTTTLDKHVTSNNWSDGYNQYRFHVNAFGLKSIYYTLFLLFSIAGTIFDGYFFVFHLFHIVVISSHLQKLARVIQNCWKYLALLGLLMVAIVYLYGIVIFLFFRDYWEGSANERSTYNLFQCWVSLLHHGLIERTNHADTDFADEIRYAAFDLGFFLVITILCLYLALGIIVDSFSGIRKKQEYARQDDTTVCFICNQTSNDLHQDFAYHIQEEHNLWNYMMFLINLDQMHPNHMTGLENFVLFKLKTKELDFFPNKMSSVNTDLELKMHQIELRMADLDSRLSRETDLMPSSFRGRDL